ncbi:MAG: hypothetical protein WCQ21_34890 [Verrucomicrobiota bacterium]|jgi:hypothetical protein
MIFAFILPFFYNSLQLGQLDRHFFASLDGANSAGPYSWSVLLPLVVLEEICDLEPDRRIRLNGTWEEELSIRNVPLFGQKFDVEVKPGRTTLLRDGKVVLRAEKTVMRETIAH